MAERLNAGKAETAVLQLEACHRAGRLIVAVSDDGYGIDIGRVRQSVVERNLTDDGTRKNHEPRGTARVPVSSRLHAAHGGFGDFRTRVGLDVVQAMAKRVGGSVTISTERGKGTRFQMELPLTLSIVRTLVVDHDG